ncbi:MAG: phosphoethanolamine transferase [Polynucleobacter sp.]
MRYPSFNIRLEWLILILATYFSLFLNQSLWTALINTQSGSGFEVFTFMAAVAVAVTALQFGILSLLIYRPIAVSTAIIILLTGVSADFFAKKYGVFFDTSMVRNIVSTNHAEARELFTPSLALHFLIYGLPGILLLACFKVNKTTLVRGLTFKIAMIILAIVVALASFMTVFKNFSATMRNNKEIRHLVLPMSYLISTPRVIFDTGVEAQKELLPLGQDAVKNNKAGAKPTLLVLVVGETVRAANWGLSGYERQTTPSLAKQDVINFPYVVSCGTNTEVSVPCMFSALGRKQYDEKKIRSTESLLHLIARTGVPVTWIDNQSGCKGVCKGLENIDAKTLGTPEICPATGCYDETLLRGLEATIKKSTGDQVVVLHQLGNHGPAYYARYPKAFEKFKPVCSSSDLGRCTQQEIFNAYDNAILYTDHILSRAIDLLKTKETRNVVFIYVSDHGESLGEGGFYLHGLPYSIAPKEQTRAPMMMWASEQFVKQQQLSKECMMQRAKEPAHHDNLFHTVLGLMNISTSVYDPAWDLTAKCKK